MLALLALLAAAAFLFYFYSIRPLYFWDRKKVPNTKGWPVFGKQAEILFGRKAPVQWLREAHWEFPGKRYCGTTQFNRPILVLRDPALIKRVIVKDFEHFQNRIPLVSNKTDPILANSLLFQSVEDWRPMRCTLSPAFTSAKMKNMHGLINECAEQFVNFFLARGSNVHAVNTKELLMRFANDVIATCAFGVNVDSLRDKENEFFKMGQQLGNNGLRRIFKLFVYFNLPWLSKVVNLEIFPNAAHKFFSTIVEEALEYRKANKTVRHDMIHILNEAKKGVLKYEEHSGKDSGFATLEEINFKEQKKLRKNITDQEIISNCTMFFSTFSDQLTTGMSFLMHELALNTDIQNKLRDEIDTVYKKSHGVMGYDDILGMKYMDMVVSESLRKWPSVPFIHRTATKEYKIPAERKGESDLVLKPGQAVMVSIAGMHRDAEYYPDPEKFDPERFSPDNVAKLDPYSYLPFGAGPRSCIASRLALLTIKTFLATTLASLEIVAVERTPNPVKLRPGQLTAAPDVGFWIGIKPRPNNEATPYY